MALAGSFSNRKAGVTHEELTHETLQRFVRVERDARKRATSD
jgi:hypothetical protein